LILFNGPPIKPDDVLAELSERFQEALDLMQAPRDRTAANTNERMREV